MSFLDKLSERADNMGTKHIAILFAALIFLLIILITGLYFLTKKPTKPVEDTEAEQKEVKKELKSPIKALPEPIKENKVEPNKEDTKPISIEEAKKLNAEIMADGNATKPDGPLDEIDKLIKEDEKRTSSKVNESVSNKTETNDNQKKNEKPESKKETKQVPTLPMQNPYNIGKKEDLGVMIDALKLWNEEQLREYEDEKKKAKKLK